MNSYRLTTLWLEILALIAVEVGLVALFFALVQRWCPTAVWRRTLCQAALITSLMLALSELSGAGRSFVARFFRTESHPMDTVAASSLRSSSASGEGTLTNKTQLDPEFRSKVMTRLAKDKPEVSNLAAESSLPISGAESPSDGLAQTLVASKSRVTNHPLPITDSTAMLLLAGILGVGAAFVAGRACLGRLILVLVGARRRAVADSELLERVDLLARRLKFSRRVRIVESRRLMSPIAFGFIRPTIGLPPKFCDRFSAAKQEAMLTHELAHLAAHDPCWYLLADLVAGVLWWHPGVWWLRRQLQLSSELAADEASLMTAKGPRVLAECLVEMGAQLAKPALGQLRVAGFRSDLGCRVEQLMWLEGAQWRPISRARVFLARSLGPITVAGTVIFCTAWAVPKDLTKGDSMKTMKQNWQRALATFATMAAIQSPIVLNAQENPPPTGPARPAGVAPLPVLPATQNAPVASGESARQYRVVPVGPTPEGGNSFVPGQPSNPAHSGRLEAKLREIVIDEVKFDGLPLSEVLSFLSEESHKRDSEKNGINFLINPNPPQGAPSAPGSIDPATGLPLPAVALEPIDIGSVNVKFNMPLRHVTMADVLDAIVRVADRPIQYSVEDYAVIFSLRADANVMPTMAGRIFGPAPLAVRTFHVDTNTFVAGLESAFGIKVETKGKGDSQSRKIQSALKELLVQLNVTMEGNKAIFYNELTGTVMVRVAAEDVEVIQAAIETLGGQAMGGYAMGYTPGMPPAPGNGRR